MARSSIILALNRLPYYLTALLVMLNIALSGCPQTGYIGQVTVYVPQQSIKSVRTAWLVLGGFEGPLPVKGASADCLYYKKLLTRSDVEVSVTDCSEPAKEPANELFYSVIVSQLSVGNRSDVRTEIEAFIEDVRKTIQSRLPDAKITVKMSRAGTPF